MCHALVARVQGALQLPALQARGAAVLGQPRQPHRAQLGEALGLHRRQGQALARAQVSTHTHAVFVLAKEEA